MSAHAAIGHNGGPPMRAADVQLGEKYFPLFGEYDHAALFGGRGSAKSHAVGTVLPILSAKKPLRVVCARQFQNSIEDSAKALIELKIRALGLMDQYAIYEREIVHRKFESRYTFIGLDRNPDSAKSLEGCDICWVEEARNINRKSLETLIPSVLRKPGSRIIWTWNPVFPKDPVDALFRGNHLRAEERANWAPPPNSFVQRVGIEDNPYFYHGQLAKQAEHMRRTNPKRYLHIWGGDYDTDFEGRIFSNVEIARVEVPDHVPPRYGIDFSNGGAHPHAAVKVYVNLQAKWIYIAREAGGRVPLDDLPSVLREVLESDGDLVKGDGARPDAIQFLNSRGFNVHAATKGPDSIRTGISWLQGFKIYIDPECTEMIEEARMYSWQKDAKTGEALARPVDDWNHYWDAVRYATEDCQTQGDGAPRNDGGVLKLRFGRRR